MCKPGYAGTSEIAIQARVPLPWIPLMAALSLT